MLSLAGRECGLSDRRRSITSFVTASEAVPFQGERRAFNLKLPQMAKSDERLLYELLFTASLLGLVKRISATSRKAPTTMALSATLNAGQ